ncbi:MAG: carotenoid oxygenase family protein [Cyanobacteria bacterium P01_A01_bin.105]
MTTTLNPPQRSSRTAAPQFPMAALIAGREEFDQFELTVLDGAVPTDLHGHIIAMGAVGNVAMKPLPGTPAFPASDGTSRLNGDGMVHRFDCGEGSVRLTSRILKTPCYYADRASTLGTRYSNLQFYSGGLARFSFQLGFRNLINTACIPVKFVRDNQWRLLATWDAGRPYEIDPVTLKAVTPVGSNQEWQPQSLPIKQGPFQLVTTATHAAYDDHTHELFTVNWGKSLLTMMSPTLVTIVDLLTCNNSLIETLLHWGLRVVSRLVQFAQLALHIFGIVGTDFVNLIQWEGESAFKTWRVLRPNGLPLQIEQSMHQLAATRHHIVLMDTAFKLGAEQLVPNLLPGQRRIERLLHKVLNSPQLPDTRLYIVNRADLTPEAETVTARPVTIPREIAHFRVDYDDREGIVLHVAHNNAWDAAEFPQAYDQYVVNTDHDINRVVGMPVTTTDLNYLARYTLDTSGKRVTIKDTQLVSDPTLTWAPALYADSGNLGLPERYRNIYWNTWGCWGDLLTEYIYDLYKDYKYRQMPLDAVKQVAQQGMPASLCRLETETMEICDRYIFPTGTFGNSPQFIPRSDTAAAPGTNSDTNGYLACVVLLTQPDGTPDSQIWLFDAQDLAAGPVCKLGATPGRLQLGMTVHTTWVPKIAPRTAQYNIPVREDYDPLIQDESPLVKELFEAVIYPNWER